MASAPLLVWEMMVRTQSGPFSCVRTRDVALDLEGLEALSLGLSLDVSGTWSLPWQGQLLPGGAQYFVYVLLCYLHWTRGIDVF